MSSLAIKNLSTARIWLRDLYVYLDPGETKIANRTPTEMGDMRGLQDYIDQGLVEVTITLPTGEIKSELVAVWPLGLNWRPVATTVIALNALPVAKNRLGDIRVVTQTLVPYVWDGMAWISLVNFAGPPAAHASTHTTGGVDPLTIDDGTTGLTVNSATATNNAFVANGHYVIDTPEADGTQVGLVGQTSTGAIPTRQPGVPRTIDITFPANWATGSITINGTGRSGDLVTETYGFPPGGGVVAGTKPFYFLTDFVNDFPIVGPVVNATLGMGRAFGVPEKGVVAFLKISFDGVNGAFSISDVANGTFDMVGNHNGNHGIDVWYTYSVTPTQAGHTHTVTDPGHAHSISV